MAKNLLRASPIIISLPFSFRCTNIVSIYTFFKTSLNRHRHFDLYLVTILVAIGQSAQAKRASYTARMQRNILTIALHRQWILSALARPLVIRNFQVEMKRKRLVVVVSGRYVMVWYDRVWDGMTWYDVLWYGMECYYMVWFDYEDWTRFQVSTIWSSPRRGRDQNARTWNLVQSELEDLKWHLIRINHYLNWGELILIQS
jgi:hypothetical protein